MVRGFGLYRVKVTFLVFLRRKNIPGGKASSRCKGSCGYPCPEELTPAPSGHISGARACPAHADPRISPAWSTE